MNININELRISKLRDYLFDVVSLINTDYKQINANMLSDDINNYSIDKIPTSSEVEKWIIGPEIHRDVFSFRSRCSYSQDYLENVINVGFFERFEQEIHKNNSEGILPDIDGIEEIKCLNCGTLNNAGTNTAEFDIQIQIKYIIN